MSGLVFAVVIGIGVGGIYAMLGTGLVTAFKGSGVINFAHGAFAMYAAYTYNAVNTTGEFALPWIDLVPGSTVNVPVWVNLGRPGSALVSAVVALAMAALLGVLAHTLVFWPLRRAPSLGKLIASVGIMLYLNAMATLHFGAGTLYNPGFLPGTSGTQTSVANFLGLGDMPKNFLWYAACAVAMGAAVWVLLRFTRFGLATRACDENEKGAALLGCSPQRVALLNWTLSAFLAGMAGIIIVGMGALQVAPFTLLVVPALAAALVGNLTSVPLTVLGGFLTGMAQSGVVHLAGESWWPGSLPANGMRVLVPLLVIVIVLFVRGRTLPERGALTETHHPRSLEARRPWVGAVVAGIMIVALSSTLSGKWELAVTTTMVTAMLMLSWVVIVGFLGQVSLVQSVLAGLAAFVAVRFVSSGAEVAGGLAPLSGPGWPSPLAFLVGVGAAVVVGVLVGLPALRIRGMHLAVVSLAAVGPINDLILSNRSVMTDAGTGTVDVPRPNWFGIDVGAVDPTTQRADYWHFTVFTGLALVLMGLAVANLRRGATGRRFLAVRADERAAAASGISVARTKVLGLAISSALAGVAGVFQAYLLGSIQTSSYGVFIGLAILATVYLGGITSVWGAVIGASMASGGLIAVILSHVSSSDFRLYISLIGAVGVILTVILNPDGISTRTVLLVRQQLAKRAWRLRHSPEASAARATTVHPPTAKRAL